MAIIHIVLFEFKPTIESTLIQNVCTNMLGLREKCLHPTTGKPYILSASGGRDNSPEGHQGGFSHGFVFEFANEEDRAYYIANDPVHQAFVGSLEGVMQNVRVVDYEPGKF